MINKGSDINVGSIEENIKNLEKYIELVIDKNYCECNELNVICYGKYADGSKNVASSIKNILKDYARQKQINEEHQKINGELREKVKELENENISKQKAYDDCYCEYKHYKQFESISIQKIIEKIEELKKLIEKIKEDNQYSNEIPLYEHDIKLLEELLQESEDK